MKNKEQVREVVETFVDGPTIHEEIEIGNGIYFHFDNPFEDDLEETHVVAILQISESEYPDFDPENDDLYDVDAFEHADVNLLRIFNEVFEDVMGSEYDSQENDYYNYYYMLFLDN